MSPVSPADPPRGLFDDLDEPVETGEAGNVIETPAVHPGSRDNPFTISALNALVRGILEDEVGSVWVAGEISNWRPYASGHWYFTLKDQGSEIAAVMFAGANRRVRFEPGDGLEILARGAVTVYPQRGKYQIVLDEMIPQREGALQLAFKQLHDRLSREGLFDAARKRPIPLVPSRIGLVTSLHGAALRDILRVLRDRFAGVSVVLRDARVQGEGAAADIAAGIRELNALGGLDVLIVGRGGGSIEDLWAFNEEAVVRAIVASTIPVISAVGHEVDVTLADLAADLRAATPSAAAEKVIGSRVELAGRLDRLRRALASQALLAIATRRRRAEALARSRALTAIEIRVREERQAVDEFSSRAREALARKLSGFSSRLARLEGRLSPRSLAERLARRSENLAFASERLRRAAFTPLDAHRADLGRLAGLLDSLSPLGVLERGYALAFDAEGAILREAAGARPGDAVSVRLRRGRLGCRVESVDPGDGN